jgi:hypothetical protein
VPAPDPITLFIAPLNRLGIPYVVTGAVAAIIYGEPRLTNDIDLVIDLAAKDVERLRASFSLPDFYVPPAEAMALELTRPHFGHFNIIHAPTSLQADFYPTGDDPLHRWALSAHRHVRAEGEELSVAPPEYVILRKLEYPRAGGSPKHVSDIRAILAAMRGELNHELLLREIQRLGVDREWQVVSAA